MRRDFDFGLDNLGRRFRGGVAPNFYGSVIGGGNQTPTVEREEQRFDFAFVVANLALEHPRFGMPQNNSAVVAARSQSFAIGGKRDRPHYIEV